MSSGPQCVNHLNLSGMQNIGLYKTEGKDFAECLNLGQKALQISLKNWNLPRHEGFKHKYRNVWYYWYL